MARGYTHRTTRAGSVITKAYQGPDAGRCCSREAATLTALAGSLPVPPVLATGPGTLQTGLMPGVHGQDLIEAGLAGPVLAACGIMLRRIHELPVPAFLLDGTGTRATFLVHGDFGPNNLLLDDRAQAVTAVLDWEWAHAGDPVEDLAWCEFIVRLHHPAEVAALDGFYAGYGSRPPWPHVREAIVSRCESMLAWCRSWEPDGPRTEAWTDRLAVVRSWTRLPSGRMAG
jgi:aminoglycoside phosphotransferase